MNKEAQRALVRIEQGALQVFTPARSGIVARGRRDAAVLTVDGKQDENEAAKWFRLAEPGDAYAQFLLGLSYFNGQRVPKDYVRAHMWFNLAAENGFAESTEDRDAIAREMTQNQIAEAQRLAREWQSRKGR